MQSKFKATLMACVLAAGLVPAQVGAQSITLSLETSTPTGAGGLVASHMAEVAAERGIATIQVQTGKTLTKSIQQVAEGQTDIVSTPLVLYALLSRGLGPYGKLGKEKGAALAANLRLLYPTTSARSSYLLTKAPGSTAGTSWKVATCSTARPVVAR